MKKIFIWWIWILAPLSAIAENDLARLTSQGQKHYSRDFVLSGYVQVHSSYVLRSQIHPLAPNTYIPIGIDLYYNGFNFNQSLAALDEGYETISRLQYDAKVGKWDIGLEIKARTHFANSLQNRIEYSLTNGLWLDNHRLAVRLAQVGRHAIYTSVQMLYEWRIEHGEFHWQNLLGYEPQNSVADQVKNFVGIDSATQQKFWFKSHILIDFHRQETWRPVFDLGFYLFQNQKDELGARFLAELNLYF